VPCAASEALENREQSRTPKRRERIMVISGEERRA
jgi:hypothetical protein